MRFLLDAGVPSSLQEFLEGLGHDVLRVTKTELRDASDNKIFSFIKKTNRVLITRDKGFGNIKEYPLETHKGIIVIRDPNLRAAKITRLFKKAWFKLELEKFSSFLAVITSKRVRIKRI